MNNFTFTGNTARELSSEYRTIGDTSLKMNIITLNTAYYCEYRSNNTFNEVGKTVTFQADIYTNYDCRICIYTYVEGYTFNFATIPINTPGTYSVTRTIPENAAWVLYRVEPRDYSHADAFVYTDNWRLII